MGLGLRWPPSLSDIGTVGDERGMRHPVEYDAHFHLKEYRETIYILITHLKNYRLNSKQPLLE